MPGMPNGAGTPGSPRSTGFALHGHKWRRAPDDPQSQLAAFQGQFNPGVVHNIHLDPADIAGAYANFANISFSRYEFTLTFARIEHEVEEGDVPGAVVARVNASPRFVEELMAALQDSWSKWQTTEGIRNLPEAPDH